MIPYELQKLQKLGYKVFTGEPYDLNFIGVRTSNKNQASSPMDDYFIIIYKDLLGSWVSESFPGTTDPTLQYLQNPINTSGTAIVVEGQYSGLWQLGLHHGTRPALVQVGSIKVYRDSNKNQTLDINPASIQTGQFAINFHNVSGSLNFSSAGCQVVEKQQWVDRIRTLLSLQAKHGHGSKLSYTLVKEEDLFSKI